MIQIRTRRVGLVVIAMTANDDGYVISAVGVTSEHARRRLVKGLAR